MVFQMKMMISAVKLAMCPTKMVISQQKVLMSPIKIISPHKGGDFPVRMVKNGDFPDKNRDFLKKDKVIFCSSVNVVISQVRITRIQPFITNNTTGPEWGYTADILRI